MTKSDNGLPYKFYGRFNKLLFKVASGFKFGLFDWLKIMPRFSLLGPFLPEHSSFNYSEPDLASPQSGSEASLIKEKSRLNITLIANVFALNSGNDQRVIFYTGE